MTTPNNYADLRGDDALEMLNHLILKRGGENAERAIAAAYPELAAAVKKHKESEELCFVLGKYVGATAAEKFEALVDAEAKSINPDYSRAEEEIAEERIAAKYPKLADAAAAFRFRSLFRLPYS